MTPNQQAAIEAAIGRPLTAGEVTARAAEIASRSTGAVAAFISGVRVKPSTVEIGNGTILNKIGVVAGNKLLDELNTNALYRYVKPILEQGRLIVGSPLVQATLKSMVPNTIDQTSADILCALGWDAHPISEAEVVGLLFNTDGSNK